ncbi:hypothetical protein GCM10008967_30190 [Bacillus carboniphilus]|uniref:DUF2007 domain-containing protein n=1 Tax=Bacillus carboniphilus TaxID=86663 RepID=A0ABN0WHD9_9BACI
MFETFFARRYSVFTTIHAGEFLRAKEKLMAAGIKFKVESGCSQDIRFAASVGSVPHTIKVLKKDYERAKEIIKGN